MKVETLKRIQALHQEAAAFDGFHTNYAAQYANDADCDKKGFGFGKDDRFSGFQLKTHFASWSGYYGSSSCGTIFSVQNKDLVHPFLVDALNEHQRAIFATVARLMREEAASLAEKAQAELANLQKMLDATKKITPTVEMGAAGNPDATTKSGDA